MIFESCLHASRCHECQKSESHEWLSGGILFSSRSVRFLRPVEGSSVNEVAVKTATSAEASSSRDSLVRERTVLSQFMVEVPVTQRCSALFRPVQCCRVSHNSGNECGATETARCFRAVRLHRQSDSQRLHHRNNGLSILSDALLGTMNGLPCINVIAPITHSTQALAISSPSQPPCIPYSISFSGSLCVNS